MRGPLTGGTYEIVVGATLTDDWSHWFDGFDVESSGGTTRIRGTVADQSALHGLLARFRDLGLPILEVHHLSARPGTDAPTPNTPPGT